MELKDAVPIGAALIALMSAIVSISVSLYTARRTTFLNTITVERIKWIGELRNKISSYISLIRSVEYATFFDGDYINTDIGKIDMRKINELNSLMKLQLNLESRLDRNIIGLMDRMIGLIGYNQSDLLYKCEDMLVQYSQLLLKSEWEKVKSEASWSRSANRARERAITVWMEENPIERVGAKVPLGVQLRRNSILSLRRFRRG